MSMTISSATARLSRELKGAEASLADALSRVAALKSTMAVARRDTGVAVAFGQDAMLRTHKVEQSLLTATGDIARVHSSLLTAGRELCAGDIDPNCLEALTPAGADTGERVAA